MGGVMKSQDQREAEQLAKLRPFLADVKLETLADLSSLPVLRKGELLATQAAKPPFGAVKTQNVSHIFQSPGPIYEPGGTRSDWWRFGRFLTAMGLTQDDIVQNTFAYHFTPAGAMFESAARSIGATVFPAGSGQTRQQAEVAAAIGTTVYAGTPDYLGVILAKGAELGLDLSRLNKAAVSAGPLFPQLRQDYLDQGIMCRQCYGTADAGLIAYETADCIEGMFVDDDVILEIVTPGTGTPVSDGEIGEVLVTVLNPDYPLVRFSVGDLSAIMPDAEGARRIVGWRGRADQAAKVKGMFIRPEQVASLVDRHPEIDRARVEVHFDGKTDKINVTLETNVLDASAFHASVADILQLRADVSVVAKGELPRDGVVIADLRPQVS